MAIRFDEFDFGDMGGLDYYNPYQTITPEVMVNPYQNYYEPALPSVQPEPSYYTYGAVPSADVFDYEADNRRAFEEAERIRVAEELRQAELIRQEQIRQAEIQRQQEMARQEAIRQAELQRQAELAEMQRRQAEQEAAARAEQERQREIARQAEIERQEMARRAEQERIAREQQLEAQRQAELQRQQELARQEAARRQAELAEIQRRQAEQEAAARQAEAARVAEQQRQEQIAREQELQRLAQQQEAARVAQEQQAARLAAEEAARVQEPVGALTPVPEPEASVKEPIAESPEPVGALTPIKEEPMYTSALPSEERNIVTALPGTKPEPGLPVEEPVVSASTAPLASDNAAIAPPYVPPGLEAALLRMQGKSPEQLAAREQTVAETKTEREVLSSLLQSNQFDAAFKYAMDNNVQNLLIDPTELKTLRGPFSNDEMKSFFSAMPKDLMGEQKEREVKFTPDKALEQSLQVAQIPKEGAALGPLGELIGYPDVQRAFEPQELVKEMTAFDKLIRAAVIGGVAYAGGTALAGLGGAGGAGAASAGTGTGGALSGVKSAYQAVAAIPAKIGGAVANAVGLPISSPLAQAAFGNSIISGATTAAKGGDIGDIIKSGLMAAGVTYGLNAAVNAVKGIMPEVSNAVGNEVSKAAATTGVNPANALDALEEIVVTARRVAEPAAIVGAVTGSATTPKQKSPLEEATTEAEPLEEVTVTSQRVPVTPAVTPVTPAQTSPLDQAKPDVVEEPTVEDLEEVTVTAKRPEILPIATPPPAKVEAPLDVVKETPVEEPAVEDLEEVKVTAKRPEVLPIVAPPPAKVEAPLDLAKETPVEEPSAEDLEEVKVTAKRPETPPVAFPEGPIEEVKVQTKRPLEEELDLPPLDIPLDTPITLPKPDVVDGRIEYPEEDLEEVVVRTTPTPDGGLDIPPITIPTTTKVDLPKPKINEPNPLKDLLDKYGTLENFLKLLGALGSAGSGSRGGGTAPSMPSMGGALPKYNYARQQLSPDIDYYTYGTRPEAKFFEDNLQLEKPVQPELPPAKPPGEDVPMATGGLTGYAKGGSKSSRYVDGPGSGREDKIPALLSDGEYVIDAETLALLGDGSTKEGARRMDKFRANIRKHKGRALSRGRISPNAKSPNKYMGGGLT